MGALLLLVFIVLPILEIIVFIRAGEWIGLWPTVAGIVLTAVIGTVIVRHQGLSTLARAQQSIGAGRFPVSEVFDGLCIVVAGALLITPGFLTDTVGFVLLVPAFRALLRRIVGHRMLASGRVKVWTDAPPGERAPRRERGGVIIDAEYERVPEEPQEPQEPDERPASGESQPDHRNHRNHRIGAEGRGGSPWRKADGEGGGKQGGKRDARGDDHETDGR